MACNVETHILPEQNLNQTYEVYELRYIQQTYNGNVSCFFLFRCDHSTLQCAHDLNSKLWPTVNYCDLCARL